MAEAGQAGTALAAPGGAGPLERVGSLAGNLRGRWGAMPPERRNWMVVSVLVVAAMVAGMVWYAGRTDWRVLFSGLDAKDTQQIGQELATAGIRLRWTPAPFRRRPPTAATPRWAR